MGSLASSLTKNRSDESRIRSEEVMNEDEDTEVVGAGRANVMAKDQE